MSKLTQDHARAAAVQAALFSLALEEWLQGCTAEQRVRRVNRMWTMIIPDICVYCGYPEAEHDVVANGKLCQRQHGGNGTTFTSLRQCREAQAA